MGLLFVDQDNNGINDMIIYYILYMTYAVAFILSLYSFSHSYMFFWISIYSSTFLKSTKVNKAGKVPAFLGHTVSQ